MATTCIECSALLTEEDGTHTLCAACILHARVEAEEAPRVSLSLHQLTCLLRVTGMRILHAPGGFEVRHGVSTTFALTLGGAVDIVVRESGTVGRMLLERGGLGVRQGELS